MTEERHQLTNAIFRILKIGNLKKGQGKVRYKVQGEAIVETSCPESGGRTKHDPKKPWGDVFERAINPAWTSAYWYKNVEVPARMVKTGIAKLSNYIDQDALIAASAHEHVATQHMENRIAGHESGSSGDYGPPTKKPKPNPKPNPKAAPNNPKAGKMEPRKIANGVYVSNNAGIGLCGGFQKGNCTQTKNGRCANNPQRSHQCNKCLHNSHGGVGCDAVPGAAKAPRGPGGKAGKGGQGKSAEER